MDVKKRPHPIYAFGITSYLFLADPLLPMSL